MEHWWCKSEGRKAKYSKIKACVSLSNTNLTTTGPEPNTGLWGERPAINRLTWHRCRLTQLEFSPYRAVISVSVTKTSQLMLYREIIAVCFEIHTKHVNTLCGQNVELVNVELAGACNKESAWRVRHWIYSANKTNDTEPELHFSVMGITSWVPQSITVQSSQLLVRVRAPLLARCGLCQAALTPHPAITEPGTRLPTINGDELARWNQQYQQSRGRKTAEGRIA